MAITFDGTTKIATLSTGTVALSVIDLWSRWEDWVATSDNIKYLPMFESVGGNTIDAGAGTSIPLYCFLINGWRIKPQEANHTLNVTSGVLLVSGGGDPFVNTTGSFVVRINYSQPVQAITVSTGGGGGSTAADVWAYPTRTLTTSTSTAFLTPLAFKVSTTTTAADPGPGRLRWNSATQSAATELYLDTITDDGTDIDNYVDLIPVGSLLYVQDKDDASNVQKWLITTITHNVGWSTFGVSNASFAGGNLPNNHSIVVLFNNQIAGALSTEQATQLAELYRIHGLQLGFPLSVTETSRQSDGVNQSISSDGVTTVVTRL